MSGDRKMKAMISSSPWPRSESMCPLAASAAPTRPPIRACEELVGSPRVQVMMFQLQAAIRVAVMSRSLITCGSMTSPWIVAATFRGKTRVMMAAASSKRSENFSSRGMKLKAMGGRLPTQASG